MTVWFCIGVIVVLYFIHKEVCRLNDTLLHALELCTDTMGECADVIEAQALYIEQAGIGGTEYKRASNEYLQSLANSRNNINNVISLSRYKKEPPNA